MPGLPPKKSEKIERQAVVARGGGERSSAEIHGAIAELASNKGKMSSKTRKEVARRLKSMLKD